MSQPPQNIPPLTSGEFADFLYQNVRTPPHCECGHGVWLKQVDGDPDAGDDVPMFLGTVPDRTLQKHLAFFLLTCANCGNTKFYSAPNVLEWRANRAKD